jgi:hypothetical protein
MKLETALSPELNNDILNVEFHKRFISIIDDDGGIDINFLGRGMAKQNKNINEIVLKIIQYSYPLSTETPSLYKIESAFIKFDKEVPITVSKIVQNKVERMCEVLSKPTSRIVISGNKGVGKTSLIKEIKTKFLKPFIIDSDDWGKWLSFVLSELNGKLTIENNRDLMMIGEVKRVTAKFIEKYYVIGDKNIPSYLEKFIKYSLTTVESGSDDLGNIWQEYLKLNFDETYNCGSLGSRGSYVNFFINHFFARISSLHQQLLDHPLLSVRQFHIYLSELSDEYQAATSIIQFIHSPVESNALPSFGMFMNVISINSNVGNMLYRLVYGTRNYTDEDMLLNLTTDLILFDYYDRIKDLRDTPLYIRDVLYIFNSCRSIIDSDEQSFSFGIQI